MSIEKLVGTERRLTDVTNRVQTLESSLGNTQQLAVEGAIAAYTGTLPSAAEDILTGAISTALTDLDAHVAVKDAEIDVAIAAIRSISSVQIVSGFLIIFYSDGTTENAGAIGGGTVTPTINNTLGNSTLAGSAVVGFLVPANDIDYRLTALGA